jgi:hypothetical protein
MPGRIDPAVKERALRLIADHRQDYPSDTALAAALAGNIGRRRASVGWCRPTSTPGPVSAPAPMSRPSSRG